MAGYWEVPDELPPGAVVEPVVAPLPAAPVVLSVALPLVPLLPLLPAPGVGLGAVSGVALELLPALPAPLSELPMLPVLPELLGLSVPLGGVELGGVLGVAVVPEVLELPLAASLPALSFLPQAVSARAATMAASKTECFMSVPLKKIYLSISTLDLLEEQRQP